MDDVITCNWVVRDVARSRDITPQSAFGHFVLRLPAWVPQPLRPCGAINLVAFLHESEHGLEFFFRSQVVSSTAILKRVG